MSQYIKKFVKWINELSIYVGWIIVALLTLILGYILKTNPEYYKEVFPDFFGALFGVFLAVQLQISLEKKRANDKLKGKKENAVNSLILEINLHKQSLKMIPDELGEFPSDKVKFIQYPIIPVIAFETSIYNGSYQILTLHNQYLLSKHYHIIKELIHEIEFQRGRITPQAIVVFSHNVIKRYAERLEIDELLSSLQNAKTN